MTLTNHGVRKAAILIASLDHAGAEALLTGMSPAQADAVRAAVEHLGEVDPLEQNEVIDEFFRIGPLVPDKHPCGIELSDRAPVDFHAPQMQETAHSKGGQGAAPLRSLKDIPLQVLVGFLRHEHPQTIAVVVSRLPSERAAEVLAALPAEMQIGVARRLVDLDDTAPTILREIEDAIAARLCEHAQSDRRRTAGLDALNKILGAANPQVKQHILANLSRHDRNLAGKIHFEAEPAWSFTDLAGVDAASLSALLHHAQREVVALALAGAEPEFAEQALAVLPTDESRWLRDALAHLGPTRLSDVEEAQRELADLAQQLERRGEISLSKRGHLSVAV
jgi:flagellar motor switch protein FliG